MLRLPCGDGNYIVHSRCVLVAVSGGRARSETQAPLVCSVGGGPSIGDGRPLMPRYRPTPIFEMQPLP